MVGWHQRLNGHEFEQTPGDSEGQGSLVCCSPWHCRVRHDLATEPQQQPATFNYRITTIIEILNDHDFFSKNRAENHGPA